MNLEAFERSRGAKSSKDSYRLRKRTRRLQATGTFFDIAGSLASPLRPQTGRSRRYSLAELNRNDRAPFCVSRLGPTMRAPGIPFTSSMRGRNNAAGQLLCRVTGQLRKRLAERQPAAHRAAIGVVGRAKCGAEMGLFVEDDKEMRE
jgi:hypothetical protein